MEPVLLSKETQRVSRPERPRGDAGHAFLSKPAACSPGKGSEPRALPPPVSSHSAIARAPAKSLAAHHASPDPPAPPSSAADLHREKTQSKPFPIQELELRSLGKTILTAATFVDAIITRQIAPDKGPREGGPLAADSAREGKTPAAPAPPVAQRRVQVSAVRPLPLPVHWIRFLDCSVSTARAGGPAGCRPPSDGGHPIVCTSFYRDFCF